ncbi:Imm1 family immunity protein [Streptomyces sp. NPDC000229]|uniref:Imm1 family immunity protein n=1 Tax=Streptomyces sp. NPDC000229 TaxID=3154247 RepID=UPI00332F6273
MITRGVKAIYLPEHFENPMILTTSEDVDDMFTILLADDINAVQFFSLDRPHTPAGWPDHELIAGVRKDRNAGVLSSMDEKCDPVGHVVSVGKPELGRGPVYYTCVDSVHDFPLFSEVPIETVRRAVKEFVASGGKRPACVEWDHRGFYKEY